MWKDVFLCVLQHPVSMISAGLLSSIKSLKKSLKFNVLYLTSKVYNKLETALIKNTRPKLADRSVHSTFLYFQGCVLVLWCLSNLIKLFRAWRNTVCLLCCVCLSRGAADGQLPLWRDACSNAWLSGHKSCWTRCQVLSPQPRSSMGSCHLSSQRHRQLVSYLLDSHTGSGPEGVSLCWLCPLHPILTLEKWLYSPWSSLNLTEGI